MSPFTPSLKTFMLLYKSSPREYSRANAAASAPEVADLEEIGMTVTANHTSVTISFNGQQTTVDYQDQAAMESLLMHARNAFGANNQHTLGLFTEDGTELQPYTNSIDSFGIKPGQVLYLKPSTVKGGTESAVGGEVGPC
jgi:hypothetical protein